MLVISFLYSGKWNKHRFFYIFQWSLQSDANNTTNDPTPITANSSKSVWSCSTLQNPSAKADPFEMLFGNSSITNAVNTQLDSGTLSPQSSQPNRDNEELVTPLYSVCHEEIYHRILNILKSNCLEEDVVECLRQVLTLIQQFGMSCTPQSGPASLNASSSCSDETNSLDLVSFYLYTLYLFGSSSCVYFSTHFYIIYTF